MLEEVRSGFKLPVLVVANKADLPQFRELDFVDMKMSTATDEGVEEVTSTLIEMVQKAIEEKRENEEEKDEFDDF
jgi:nucleolar GTP-binding protein